MISHAKIRKVSEMAKKMTGNLLDSCQNLYVYHFYGKE